MLQMVAMNSRPSIRYVSFCCIVIRSVLKGGSLEIVLLALLQKPEIRKPVLYFSRTLADRLHKALLPPATDIALAKEFESLVLGNDVTGILHSCHHLRNQCRGKVIDEGVIGNTFVREYQLYHISAACFYPVGLGLVNTVCDAAVEVIG